MSIALALAIAWFGFFMGMAFAVCIAADETRTIVIRSDRSHTPDDCTCYWYPPGTALHGLEGGRSVVYSTDGWARRHVEDCPAHGLGVGA